MATFFLRGLADRLNSLKDNAGEKLTIAIGMIIYRPMQSSVIIVIFLKFGI